MPRADVHLTTTMMIAEDRFGMATPSEGAAFQPTIAAPIDRLTQNPAPENRDTHLTMLKVKLRG